MRVIIFDLDHTLFDGDAALHAGVHELLPILRRLGVHVAGVSNRDHRVLVQLDEAGVRDHFVTVVCTDHEATPKSIDGIKRVVAKAGGSLDHTVVVSHMHSDVSLGKDAGAHMVIGVSHGKSVGAKLKEAGADHVVRDIPAILDVLG